MGRQLGLLSQLRKFKAGSIRKKRSVADFFCVKCNEEYELKSHVTSSRNTNRWLTRLGEPVGLDATLY